MGQQILSRLTVGVAAVGFLAACSDGTGPHGGGQVALNVTTPASASNRTIAASLAPATVGGHTLSLTSASVTLSHIELRTAEQASNAKDGDETDDAGSDDDRGEAVVATPTTLDLALNGTNQVVASVPLPAGTYEQLEARVSQVRITGTYDGKAFDVTVPVKVGFEQAFSPAVTVADGKTVDITLTIDPSTWLRNTDGSLIDPATLATNATARAVVARQVKQSFHAAEDRDRERDGHDG